MNLLKATRLTTESVNTVRDKPACVKRKMLVPLGADIEKRTRRL